MAGSPWAVGGTLPSGKTETGEWAFGEVTQAASLEIAVASFPIELVAPMIASTQAHYLAPGKTPTEKGLEINVNEEEVPSTTCLGTAAEPTALPGNLCVYAAAIEGGNNRLQLFPCDVSERQERSWVSQLKLALQGEARGPSRPKRRVRATTTPRHPAHVFRGTASRDPDHCATKTAYVAPQRERH